MECRGAHDVEAWPAIAALSGLAFLVPMTATAGAEAVTSPGITSSTITVGQIDDLSAPYPGLFKAAEDGTQAYFDYVNSTGGVDGRKIELNAMDSAFDSADVVKETTDIADSDFAMVGGYSLLDGGEARHRCRQAAGRHLPSRHRSGERPQRLQPLTVDHQRHADRQLRVGQKHVSERREERRYPLHHRRPDHHHLRADPRIGDGRGPGSTSPTGTASRPVRPPSPTTCSR